VEYGYFQPAQRGTRRTRLNTPLGAVLHHVQQHSQNQTDQKTDPVAVGIPLGPDLSLLHNGVYRSRFETRNQLTNLRDARDHGIAPGKRWFTVVMTGREPCTTKVDIFLPHSWLIAASPGLDVICPYPGVPHGDGLNVSRNSTMI